MSNLGLEPDLQRNPIWVYFINVDTLLALII